MKKDLTGTLREGMANAEIKTHRQAVLRALGVAVALAFALFSPLGLMGKLGAFVGVMFVEGIIASAYSEYRKRTLNAAGRKALKQYLKDANAAVEIFTKNDEGRIRRYEELSPEAKRIVDETIMNKRRKA